MPYSTCCGAHTNFNEINICPECKDHCDWEEDDEEELQEDKKSKDELEEIKINQKTQL